ncbi:GNAT family acetyltransferase [Sediminicola sp. YIK13]|uniref:GNAT family N-acetyltransferase n=1 Tax=Sediminicola sp. YIK13 TaxID=1453352 RepID=UPI00071F49E7|nr:GNAT family N-acetyltransferase [Sediminicola sp. YIK13]ALM07839.1 GNAT family acetyltransferase [Sediminicola sp. YIK13]
MVRIVKTDASQSDFKKLVALLDGDLAERDGEDHSFYDQFNKLHLIKYALVAYEKDLPVACGAIKEFEPEVMEIKRMYVTPKKRGEGIATKVLSALENWARELGYQKCVLETGKRQPEAIALYTKNGYQIIPNYGQYAGIENSVCFEKYVSV